MVKPSYGNLETTLIRRKDQRRERLLGVKRRAFFCGDADRGGQATKAHGLKATE